MPANEDLDAIVELAQGGSREATCELIHRVQGELRNFVAARAPSIDLVDEMVQAALVLAIERIRDYELRGTFTSWLKGIAVNLLRTEMRRLRRQASQLDEAVLAHSEARLDEDDEQAIAHLRDCLSELPPRSRLMLERHYDASLPIKRMAQQFKLNGPALAMALFRIREVVRRCLAAKGVEA